MNRISFVGIPINQFTFPVGENEVIEPNLSAKQLVHVDFVGVERAEKDLIKEYVMRHVNQLSPKDNTNLTATFGKNMLIYVNDAIPSNAASAAGP